MNPGMKDLVPRLRISHGKNSITSRRHWQRKAADVVLYESHPITATPHRGSRPVGSGRAGMAVCSVCFRRNLNRKRKEGMKKRRRNQKGEEAHRCGAGETMLSSGIV